MPSLPSYSAARRALVLALAGTMLAAAPALASDSARTAFDARPGKSAAAPGQAVKALKQALGDQGLVSRDPHTGTVRAAGRLDGALTAPSDQDAAAIALGYVRAHGAALGLPTGEPPGLELDTRAVTGRMELLTWRQRHRGIPSADTYLRAAVDAQGRLLSLTGAPAAELDPPTLRPALRARDALSAVTGRPAPKGEHRGGDPEQLTEFPDGARASLVLYQGEGGARLGWRVLAPVAGDELADAIVDAADGTVVKRANRVKFAGPAQVFRSSPDAGLQEEQDLGLWGTDDDRLLGTRVHAFPDPGDVVGVSGDDEPQSETSVWTDGLIVPDSCEELPRCTWTEPEPVLNQNQSTTQLYYLVNTFLDHLAQPPIGFTDATGGYGPGDRILAQSMDGALTGERDNASFLAYPDGGPGLLEVHLFGTHPLDPQLPAYGLDGANDPSLVFHEVAHGLSERLVTDALGTGALNIGQAAAIGEGTSDFYALDHLEEAGLAAPPLRFGEYLGSWLRDTDVDGDELSYGPLSGQPHHDGELIAQTLWSLREQAGVTTARRLLTDALRIVPPEPSFIDLRNALLIVSQDEPTDRKIWAVFAARGMGYFAYSDGAADSSPQPDPVDPYDPPDGVGEGTLTGIVRDQDQRPVAGAEVAVGGLGADGLGPFQSAKSGADGRYTLRSLEGVHPVVRASKPAYEAHEVESVEVDADGSAQNFQLTRDWSSAAGGARVAGFTGPDSSDLGCGPDGLIDDTSESVWGTVHGSQSVVVDLGATVDVASVRIDPGAGCGDDDSAALGSADVQVAAAPGLFSPLSSPTFMPADIGTLKSAFNGARQSVRFVKLVARAPQDASAGGSGEHFIDVAELQVRKVPGTPVGPTVDTGAATAVGSGGATLTAAVGAAGGAPPDVVFEYGTTPAYGSLVAASGSPVATAAVAGLRPSTRYHFRAVALRDGRRYDGADGTFVTAPGPVVQPPPPGVQPPAATPSSIVAGKLRADRKGRFTLRVRFAGDAPLGRARVVVKAGRRKVAKGSVKVVRGGTERVRLRLTKAGRKAIKPGRTRSLRVSVRLPGGEQTLVRTLKLTRKR